MRWHPLHSTDFTEPTASFRFITNLISIETLNTLRIYLYSNYIQKI